MDKKTEEELIREIFNKSKIKIYLVALLIIIISLSIIGVFLYFASQFSESLSNVLLNEKFLSYM